MNFVVRGALAFMAAIAAVAALGSRPATAQEGTATLTGRVTVVAATPRPVDNVTVFIVGTSRITRTGADGRYTLTGIPPGTIHVRAQRLGLSAGDQTLDLPAGITSLNFTLSEVPTELGAEVITASGHQLKAELGNDIPSVIVSDVLEASPIASINDVLQSRVAGVQVLQGTMVGAGARVRLRGTTSASLSNDPVYYIDGIRIESATNSTSIGQGGTAPSRVDDIDPQDIESLEVVKGPSAAALYGTDAANGVIVISTKRGRQGAPSWNAFTQQGLNVDMTNYPDAWSGWTTVGGTPVTGCDQAFAVTGGCTLDSISHFNLFEKASTTPEKAAPLQLYGLSVAGGTPAIRYFVAGDYQTNTGTTHLPQFEIDRFNKASTPIQDFWLRPNYLQAGTGRANLDLTLSPQADLAVSTGFIQREFRFPQADNNTTGLQSNAYGGPGYENNGTDVDGNPKHGYRRFVPGTIFQEQYPQEVQRANAGGTFNWHPSSWLAGFLTGGSDFVNRLETDFCPAGNCAQFGQNTLGFRTDNRTVFQNFTVNSGLTGSYGLSRDLTGKTTFGVQYFIRHFSRNGANASILPPGGVTVTNGLIPGANESTDNSRTRGEYIEQSFAYSDRLFFSVAGRLDENSAFGRNHQSILYPKAAASWVISKEPFFPHAGWLDLLRLRAAYGQSGLQPGSTSALAFLAGAKVNVDQVDQAGVVPSQLANPNLRAERTSEVEFGADATLFHDRMNVTVTYYDKESRDEIFTRILPPSIAYLSTSIVQNLGLNRNYGMEALISATVIDARPFRWDLSLKAATNKNTLVSLGGIPTVINFTTRDTVGFPLNGYWQQPIVSYKTIPGKHVVDPTSIVVGPNPVYLGSSVPRDEVTLDNGVGLFNNRLRLHAQLDYQGRYKQENSTREFRCNTGIRNNCQELYDPNTPLSRQAGVDAMNFDPSGTVVGFIEDASFIKLRELSASYTVPERYLKSLGVRSVTVTASARNLKTWTKYLGLDPETNAGQNDVAIDFQSQPPISTFILRLNVGF